MKFLGQFEAEEGNKRIDFLKEKKIAVSAEDVFVERAARRGNSYFINTVKLSVSPDDHEAATGFLKEYEVQQQKAVEIEAAQVRQGFLKAMIGLAALLGLMACVRGFKGWW